jgi:predicted dehydrogenase
LHVPELRTASRRADLAAAMQWRDERRLLREEGEFFPLQLALVTDGNDRALADNVRAAGGDVIGLLAPDALESLVWAAEAQADHGYSALDALAADAVEVACLDLPIAEACRVGATLLAEGLNVVLARSQTPDREAVRGLLDAAGAGNASAAAGLRTRGWGSIAEAVRLVPQLGRLSQVTVVGWPSGREARAELCDVARRLCGEVIAVSGSTEVMPARELSPTDPVTLALLTAGGTTIVASESPLRAYETMQITLVGAKGRIVVEHRDLRISDTSGVRDLTFGDPTHPVRVAVEGLRDELAGATSGAAGLGDLLAAARICEMAAESYEIDAWVET